MRAMIMAAGLGTRLRPLTGLIPKPMAPILNRPALHHVLRLLERHGITDVVVNLHHFADTITSYFGDGSSLGMAIRWAYEKDLLGTAGGVKNNQAFLEGGTFLVLSGDSVTDLDLGAAIATHAAKGGIATLCVKEVDDPSEYGVVVLDPDDRVLGFQEKPSPEDALSTLCNCGVYVFEPAIFDRIPAGEFYDFGKQVLPELVRDGLPFFAHRVREYWNDVGSIEEYVRSNFDALAGRVAIEHPGRELDRGLWVGRRCFVHRTARLVPPLLIGADCWVEEGAVIEGPAVVGDHVIVEPQARVSGSIVWSGVLLGKGSRVRKGVIGRGTQVRSAASVDGGVLGERCIVGEGTRLGAVLLEPNTVVGNVGSAT